MNPPDTHNIDALDAEIRRRMKDAHHLDAAEIEHLASAACDIYRERRLAAEAQGREDILAKLRGYLPLFDAFVTRTFGQRSLPTEVE